MLSTNLGSAPLSLSMSLEEHTHGIHIDTDWGEKVLFCCCIHTIYSFMVMICSSFFVMLMILMVSRHYGSQPQIHLKCQELAMFSTILHTYSIVLYIIVKGSFEHKSENHQWKNLFKSSSLVAFSSSISSSITNTSETYTNQ